MSEGKKKKKKQTVVSVVLRADWDCPLCQNIETKLTLH